MAGPIRNAVSASFMVGSLAAASPARADESSTPATTESREPSVLPAVLGATGLTLGATSVWFFVQHERFVERGESLALTVPKGEEPCAPGGNTEFCSADKKARTASALAMASATGAVTLLASAIVVYVMETKPRARTAVVALLATPGVGGAAFSATF